MPSTTSNHPTAHHRKEHHPMKDLKKKAIRLWHVVANSGQCNGCGGVFDNWNGGVCDACKAIGRG
ncbi:hypothetical protein [Streptomyces olivochromogenes]|nr:hypothetical protein [Streptomyces olivochromogenes]